jgi:hypothetical protein
MVIYVVALSSQVLSDIELLKYSVLYHFGIYGLKSFVRVPVPFISGSLSNPFSVNNPTFDKLPEINGTGKTDNIILKW